MNRKATTGKRVSTREPTNFLCSVDKITSSMSNRTTELDFLVVENFLSNKNWRHFCELFFLCWDFIPDIRIKKNMISYKFKATVNLYEVSIKQNQSRVFALPEYRYTFSYTYLIFHPTRNYTLTNKQFVYMINNKKII